MPKLDEIKSFFMSLQDDICKGLEGIDGKSIFVQDLWERSGGGGGRTRTISGNGVIEKGGVNFSHVHGSMPKKIAEKLNLPDEETFHATGVSIVLHPVNPFVPIIHMNVRYFEMGNGHYWFGGGVDVTPSYFFRDDAIRFHSRLKNICDSYKDDFYNKFKDWCDDYFYLKHRKETRGIGGLFFDHLNEKQGLSKSDLFKFVQEVGESFVPVYQELVESHNEKPWGDREKDFQRFRQGRYVEFNLLWDKGTKFGVDTDGRTESILVSMPPMAKWGYCFTPEPNSPEAETMENLKAQDWLESVSS